MFYELGKTAALEKFALSPLTVLRAHTARRLAVDSDPQTFLKRLAIAKKRISPRYTADGNKERALDAIMPDLAEYQFRFPKSPTAAIVEPLRTAANNLGIPFSNVFNPGRATRDAARPYINVPEEPTTYRRSRALEAPHVIPR